jgi:hypothetical protein
MRDCTLRALDKKVNQQNGACHDQQHDLRINGNPTGSINHLRSLAGSAD